MKCPECQASMQVEVKEKRYVCGNCGSEIKWMKEKDIQVDYPIERESYDRERFGGENNGY